AATTSGAAYGIYQSTAATGIDVRNNIVSITRGGTGIKRAIHFNTITSTLISNKNVLYINAPAGTNNHLGQFGTTNYTTLANWQTANSNVYDLGSLSTDPSFINASGGDLKPTVGTFANLGDAVGVLRDFNDSLRSATTPDPGAIEFSNLSNGVDVTTEALVSPAVSQVGCYTNAETVSIRVRNNGIGDLNLSSTPISVTVNVTGATTQVLNGTANSGTLKSDSTLIISMTLPLNMSTTGTYTINASAIISGDVNNGNNALVNPVSRVKVDLSAGTISVSPSVFCGVGGSQPILNATSQTGVASIQWQQSTTSNGTFTNISGATTNPYTVTAPISQTMYYKALATCGTQTNSSIEDTVEFVNPQILTTTPRYTCGAGTVNLSATSTPGSTINWYAAASGGASIGTGNNFTTPNITTTTTYYVAASTSAAIGTAPIQITEIDLGDNDRFEIQN
ncbi:MAG: immunoglobulin domain-containing protein, partial [Dolichospermum sp.]